MAKIKQKDAEFLNQVLEGLSEPFHLSYRFVALGELVSTFNSSIFEQKIGLSLKALRILRIAYRFPGQPVSVVARWTFSEKAMMSKLVSRLCSLGYLERRIDEVDARSTQLFVTKAGAAVVKKADVLSNDLFLRQFPNFSPDACRSLMKTLDDMLRDSIATELASGAHRADMARSRGRRKAG
jgi:DNA-binding MarR family transcriptional regulator